MLPAMDFRRFFCWFACGEGLPLNTFCAFISHGYAIGHFQ